MVNGFRASDPQGLDKGHVSKFRVSPRRRQETPEEHNQRSIFFQFASLFGQINADNIRSP